MDQSLIASLVGSSKDNDGNIRKASAIALGDAGDDPNAKAALLKLLRDKVWQVRESAIASLGKIRAEEAGDYLVSLLGATDDVSARKAILSWAPLKSDPEAGKKDAPKKAAGGLGGAAPKKDQGEPWQVKRTGALALSRIRPNIAVEPLLAALNAENPTAKVAAMAGLGTLKAEEALEPVLELTRSENMDIRKSAATTLGRLKNTKSTDTLLGLLDDPKAAVRIEAVIALNHIKPPEALGALAKVVSSDKSPEVKKIAATALGNLRDPDAGAPLSSALKDEAPAVRKSAIDALVNLKGIEYRTDIMALMFDENEEVRGSSAVAIIRLDLLS